MIANAMVVHEALAVRGFVETLRSLVGVDEKDPRGWFRQE